MYEEAKAKLEEQNLTLGSLKEIAVSLGVKNSHVMKTKAKVIDAICNTVVDTDTAIEALVYVVPKKEKAVQAKETGDGRTDIKSLPRQKVIVHPLTEADSSAKDNIFSINAYNINIIYGEEVSIPTPMIEHIKSLKTSKPKVVGDKIINVEVARFSVSNV